jgi:hypothetical protein
MPSCTFMDIAKRYGVDYGDVLMATEAWRPEAPMTEETVRLVYEACRRLNRSSNAAAIRDEVQRACFSRWDI